MEQLIDELSKIEGVKAVRKVSDKQLRVELFSREIPGSDAEEIPGDLRKISQKLRSALDGAAEDGEISSWSWIQKPQKQYQSDGPSSVSGRDRKSAGYKPAFYSISVEMN